MLAYKVNYCRQIPRILVARCQVVRNSTSKNLLKIKEITEVRTYSRQLSNKNLKNHVYFKGMVFDNGLKVLLVSDKTSDKAAAAMGKSQVIRIYFLK